ncbi:MAG: PepSY domain-containing protein, partial [Phenylobacterium sp.]|uniref:PepSY domain-containing protein n=1 Tax=Phenylobacterium sp. TaxID=1871053 RepID=UPI001A2B2D18
MRGALVVLHRWLGLGVAGFLLIAGLTGAIISWDHEIDEWLNPALFDARTPGESRAPLELAAAAERADPRLQVTFLPLTVDVEERSYAAGK